MKLTIPIFGLTKDRSIGIVDRKILEIRTPRLKEWLQGKSRLFPWVGSGRPPRYPARAKNK